MKITRYIGFVLILLAWIWLAWAVLRGGGFNLRTLLVIVFSAIIVFLPLWRKYGPGGTASGKSGDSTRHPK